jgi:predicted nucleic acid-binding Zn ribbon protein
MAEQREKSQEPIHIGNVLNTLLRVFHEKANGNLALIWRYWDEAVGENIAQNARPVVFKGNLLYVNVTSSPWIHQLQFFKQDIIDKLNMALGHNVVNDIKFKIGI